MSSLRIVDTTLRDGEQAPGLALSQENREKLAALLDRAGIYQIEAGIPAMGPDEIKAILAIKKMVNKALISTWNRFCREDLEASFECRPDLIHICLPLSEKQLDLKLKTSWKKALDSLSNSLDLARSRGYQISVGLEDCSRSSEKRLLEAKLALAELGVKRLRLSDTVGILTPGRTNWLVGFFKGNNFSLEFHGHNDLGLATANSLKAALAGAEYVDTTIMGVGERAGNCDLKNFVRLARASGQLELNMDLKSTRTLEEAAGPLLGRKSYFEKILKNRPNLKW